MNPLRVLAARVLGIFGRRRMELDLEDELQFHFQQQIDLHVSQGKSLEEARAAARKNFGGIDRAKEAYRDTRGLPLLENFFRDLQYAARVLRKSPGFVAVAVLSLGLGIGVNCAVFTFANAAILRELPVKDPSRLARVSPTIKGRQSELSYPAFREISQRQQSFSDVAASGGLRISHAVFNGVELQELERLNGLLVSANYFGMLGVEATRGRVFTPLDSSQPGQGAVVVLRYGFWQTSLGGDPSVLGRTLVVNGTALTILGIAPPSFAGDQVGRIPDLWVPILMQPRIDTRNLIESRTVSFFRTLGRLKPGIVKAQAAAEMTGLYRQILAAENEAGSGSRINRPDPARAQVDVLLGADGFNPARARMIAPFELLLGVVALVLLIACCNVANLLLARGAARRHEISTRLALGSSRGRIVSQLLTESLLLATLGGVLGIVLGRLGTRFLVFASEDILYLTLDLRPDARVFAFTMVVSLFTTVLFGILPAMHASGTKPMEARAASGGRFRQRTSRFLVVAQVALSLWLLIGAGLLLRSLGNLHNADLGIDRGHVSTLQLIREPSVQPAEFPALQRAIADRVGSLPQAKSVALSSFGLFAKGGLTAPARVPSSPLDPSGDHEMYIGYASPGFFRALGMELVRGRDLTPQDENANLKVGVVSEAVARHYFGQDNPIGEVIYFPGLDQRNRYIPFSEGLEKARRFEIVGVVRDAFDRGPRIAPTHRIYLPIDQTRFADTLYVHTAGDPGAATPAILQVLREFSSKIRVEEVMTLEEQLSQNYSLETLGSRVLGFFGFLALVLAAVGLYGVMSFAVNRRTPEIGVRIALGARRGDVLRLVLREAAILVAAGVAVGIPLALAATRFLKNLLFGLTPDDPGTIAAVAMILFIVGTLAASVPARRASRVDPLVALRHE